MIKIQKLATINGDEDIATLQGIFNVLTQVKVENAKAMQEKKAVTQFWESLGNDLWNVWEASFKENVLPERS